MHGFNLHYSLQFTFYFVLRVALLRSTPLLPNYKFTDTKNKFGISDMFSQVWPATFFVFVGEGHSIMMESCVCQTLKQPFACEIESPGNSPEVVSTKHQPVMIDTSLFADEKVSCAKSQPKGTHFPDNICLLAFTTVQQWLLMHGLKHIMVHFSNWLFDGIRQWP